MTRWQEVASKNWSVLVGLTDKSVDTTPFWRVTSKSKLFTFSFDQSAVSFSVGRNE